MSTIKFEYDGVNYTLEYTRASAKALQMAGFDDDKLDTQSLVMLPMLFKYAFMAHHSDLTGEKIDKIFNNLTNRRQLLEELATMYYRAVNTLTDEPENSGKVEWTVSG